MTDTMTQAMRLKLMKNFGRWQLAFHNMHNSNNIVTAYTYADSNIFQKNNCIILIHATVQQKTAAFTILLSNNI